MLLPGYDIAFLRVALVLGTQDAWQHYIQGRRKRRSKEERRRPKKSSQEMPRDTLPTSPQPEYSLMITSQAVGKEQRVMELLKVSKDKRALKFIKKRVGGENKTAEEEVDVQYITLHGYVRNTSSNAHVHTQHQLRADRRA
ncbi:unnamed protein product [Rangifer tarandus platyrhynchus]|uniref:Uncharacterized protein n=1 Tax=Rangifer tarandus platyrhynchus TaxID=3082113 RepID=A0AC59YIR7_RANTA